jgi:hypothetical protein
MNEIKKLKKLRKYILTKNKVAHLATKSAVIQLDLEDVDEVMRQRSEYWRNKSRLTENKFHTMI